MKWFQRNRERGSIDQARKDALNLGVDEISSETEVRIKRSCEELPDYQNELLETSRLMASLEGLAEDPDVCAVLSVYQSDSKEKSFKKNLFLWSSVGVAAGLLLAVTISLFHVSETPVDVIRYVTKIGEQKKITLDDGSVLTMNTGTLLSVEMTDISRLVTLERGEVFFDVAKDLDRPFTVSLGEQSISVLGTKFNIYKLPDRFSLAVVEGTVAIHESQDTVYTQSSLYTQSSYTQASLIQPEPGEHLQFSSRIPRKVTADTVVEYDSVEEKMVAFVEPDVLKHQNWKTGMLSFNNVPLGKVVQELNRYTIKKILVEDGELLDIKIYATILTDQVPMALKGLEKSLSIKIVEHFDRIVITHK